MNEREALQFVMEEIKKQRRADHEMYLDMRKQTTAMYERFLDRLRELDERDYERNRKTPLIIPKAHVTAAEPPKEQLTELQGLFKTLPPAPSAHLTPSEMRVDRVEVEANEEEESRNYAKMEDVLPLVVDYLKHADGSEPLRDIQYYVESEMNYKWVNFSIVMSNLMTLDPRIQRSKVRGYYIYKEV